MSNKPWDRETMFSQLAKRSTSQRFLEREGNFFAVGGDLHGTIFTYDCPVACDFYSARCSRHGKIVYNFHDIKLPVATIVVGTPFTPVF